MGTVHSSARSTSSSSGKRNHGNGNFSAKDLHYQYPSPNHSGSTINHHTFYQQHLHPQSPTSTHHSISSSPTSPHSTLQKAFSRRRSSNQTTDTQSSHGSMGSHQGHSKHSHHSHHHHHHDSHHLPSHTEEPDEFRYFGGRRYHNTSSLYMLPNDTQEVDRPGSGCLASLPSFFGHRFSIFLDAHQRGDPTPPHFLWQSCVN
ncbi:MAG: hypothetical protein BYD32DRAFT_51821 [Podila humilis]|nr:MAG: hypothetical protein BYD32DRAFT_51821 [Podila humilis]